MKRVAIIIGIALILWGLLKISSNPSAPTSVKSEIVPSKAAPTNSPIPIIAPRSDEVPGTKTATAPLESAPTIDPQKKAELLKKQSVFKGEEK